MLTANLLRFDLFASKVFGAEGTCTVSTAGGSVLMDSGHIATYNGASCTITARPGAKLRAYIIDPDISDKHEGTRARTLYVDNDCSTPRGVYEGGLIVIGHVEVQAYQKATAQTDEALDERERTTLLAIIGALAKEAKLDLAQPYKAGETIAKMLATSGVTLGARTIGDKLKLVPDALDRRKA
jgi:hypothetical protein